MQASQTLRIPAISLSAVQMLQQCFQRDLQRLADQTLDAMHLDASWHLDFERGIAVKTTIADVPEIVKVDGE